MIRNHHLPASLLALLFAAALPAQVEPPPWWGIADNDTVSLGFDFDNQADPYAPTFSVVPPWFTGSPSTRSPNIAWLPALAGHTGVVGFSGAGAGTISLLVDNDPRPDWIKVFWFQFDEHATATGSVSAAIRLDLSRYRRSIISEESVPLGNNWFRTTVAAQLIPQPIDEDIDFTLTESALASVAIDHLFVNSKCIKPWHDEDGEPLGEVDPTTQIDLLAATGNPDCFGCAATENLQGIRRFWVTGRNLGPGLSHLLYQLTPQGQIVGAPILQPLTTAQSQDGITDLAMVEEAAGTFLYGVASRAVAAAPPVLLAYDLQIAAFNPARTIVLGSLPPNVQPSAVAYSPHGALGAGTFVLVDPVTAQAFEVDRGGAVLRTFQTGSPSVTGAGYDHFTGMFYWFGRGGSLDPRNIQVVGTEQSNWDLGRTGVQFYGDLNVPPGPGGSPGGDAAGFEAVRLLSGELRLVCLQRGAGPVLRELHGPFRFGQTLLGRARMQGGPPWRGNPNFAVGLSGVPNATFATLYLGFNNQTWRGVNLPFSLGILGLPETTVLAALDIPVLSLPVVGGSAQVTVAIPPSPIWAYAPTFWQWLVFDPTVPGGLTLSQGGKTVLY